jgi:hypothetical protein
MRALKEERDIDALVRCPDAQEIKRVKSSKKDDLDFDSVADEASTFIDYALRQYYFAPNMYVPKRERPKWRFIAKRLYRNLVPCAADPENLEEAADLVEELFVRKAIALAADGSSSRWTYSSGLSPISTTSLNSYSVKSQRL